MVPIAFDKGIPKRVLRVYALFTTVGFLCLLNFNKIVASKDFLPGADAGADAGAVISTSMHPKYASMAAELESAVLRYYIYNESSILEPEVVERTRLQGRAGGELKFIEAFQKHTLRTLDPSQADFFIAPVLVPVLRKYFRPAMDALISTPLFNRTKGKRHIFFALGGRAFDDFPGGGTVPQDLKSMYRHVVENAIIARDFDLLECEKMHKDNHNHGDWNEYFRTVRPISRNMFSVGSSDGDEFPLVPGSYDKFAGSNWTYFYHTRTVPMARGSTKYRDAPLYIGQNNDLGDFSDVINTSNIGLDIAFDPWRQGYCNSKFCLVIRGDTPHSHALLRSVRAGCIPVVVSDYYPRYGAPFKSSLNFSDFTILIDEKAFLENPGLELRKLMDDMKTRKSAVLEKIEGLKLAQRVLFPDHPQSLFVPAFLKEARLSLPIEDRDIHAPTPTTDKQSETT
jgi:hypothetical protein